MIRLKSFLQKEDYQKKLDGIIESVNGSLDGFKFDRKGLASTLAGLLQFMEDALGVKVGTSFSCLLSRTLCSMMDTLFWNILNR